MQDKTANQDQGNKNQNQGQTLFDQKKQALPERAKKDLPDERDDDNDEDENHYDDSIEKE